LQLHVDSSPLQLLSHPGMLRTVLDNLIGNAIKYTTAGTVLISVGQVDGDVHIDVRDTGIGIPQYLLGAIFEAFRQGDPGNDGLGLGLSIAKRTADSLGCQLTVESREGAGSLFRVWMPSMP
ncbi:MAG: HAMP domain-containing sensor histidine kinase, partial [Thermomonas sp.]